MFNQELFKPGVTIKILETKAEWPSRRANRCKVEIEYPDRFGPASRVEYDWVPKSQVDLAIRFAESRQPIGELTLALLEAMWEEAYEDGSTDESLNHADESI
jgi:hypothetical protein